MTQPFNYRKAISRLPDSPGVYLMRGKGRVVLYIGKAGNLQRRVSSYFLPASPIAGQGGRPQENRIQKLVTEIRKIDYRQTETAIEALILESRLIKKYLPPYNIREKDDKSFLFVEITREKFPRVLLVRGKDGSHGLRFGPFTSASSIREALRIVRKIFPFNTHPSQSASKVTIGVRTFEARPKTPVEFGQRGCFNWQIGLCPGVCVGQVSSALYKKTINNIKLFFEGKKQKIIKKLEKEMQSFAEALEYERAEKIKRQIFALQHINDVALISEVDNQAPGVGCQVSRIEGYDISNISGTSAVGSMVVFVNWKPDKKEYRKFKIKTIVGANDVGMMKEVLARRFQNNWPVPNLILVDGGLGQVNVARKVLSEFGLGIPVVGIAKGAKRKRNDIIGTLPPGFNKKTLIQVRYEAHRFAISYHKKIRGRKFLLSKTWTKSN
ncbi:MAG: excinuclease ABC subunit UvrC [Candidatus Liptonbacteria bacterium]|nr:excinuclease ABC subunit UvrC [Candidatus Liptonbacteria bacterium]